MRSGTQRAKPPRTSAQRRKERSQSMTQARRMIETNPSGFAVDAEALVECIEACFDCAQACTACADACLGEQDIQTLIRCIRLDLDCADMCGATGKVLSRQTAFEAETANAILASLRPGLQGVRGRV